MRIISGVPYTDNKAGGFPSRVKGASSQTCVFHKSMLFERPTMNLYVYGPLNVGLNGLSGWRLSRYEIRHARIRRICVTTGTLVNAPSRTATNPSQHPLLVPNALSYAMLPSPVKTQSSSTSSNFLFLFLYTLKMVNNVCC